MASKEKDKASAVDDPVKGLNDFEGDDENNSELKSEAYIYYSEEEII